MFIMFYYVIHLTFCASGKVSHVKLVKVQSNFDMPQNAIWQEQQQAESTQISTEEQTGDNPDRRVAR